MKRIWIILLAVSVALVIALPAGAKKPDKPDDLGFKPILCDVDKGFAEASVRGDLVKLPHTFTVATAKQFMIQPYTVDSDDLSPGDVLCLEVRLGPGTGSLTDLRVRWIDYLDNITGGSCGLFWARGKELRSLNDAGVFSTGLSLDGWDPAGGLCGADPDKDGGDMTVVVMPKAKSAGTQVKVTIGIEHPEEG
jgi:hypothetical protein